MSKLKINTPIYEIGIYIHDYNEKFLDDQGIKSFIDSKKLEYCNFKSVLIPCVDIFEFYNLDDAENLKVI